MMIQTTVFTPLRRALLSVLSALGLVGASADAASADAYILDKQHTEVRFTWDHLGLSRQGGRFTDISGTAVLNPDDLASSSVQVSIPVSSISTGVTKLDEHLVKSREFFDGGAFPNIEFKSTAVKLKSDRTGEITGELTINGITKPAVLDFIWNFIGTHPLAGINPSYAAHYSAGFSATTQIRRSDWGITRTIPYISDEIKITIETEMHREGGAPAGNTAPEPSEAGLAGQAAAPESQDPASLPKAP